MITTKLQTLGLSYTDKAIIQIVISCFMYKEFVYISRENGFIYCALNSEEKCNIKIKKSDNKRCMSKIQHIK